jgi:glycosyltransferase involved in cell wall biosynthesis
LNVDNPPRIAVYHEHLRGGGATQVVLHIINGLLDKGYAVDLVVNDPAGEYRTRVPAAVHIESLVQSSQEWARFYMLRAASGNFQRLARSVFVSHKQLDKLRYLPSLSQYIKRRKPVLVLSNLWQLALTAVSARDVCMRSTAVVCIFHSAYFHHCAERLANAKRPAKWRHFIDYCNQVYTAADFLITVSHGITSDLVDTLGLPPEKIRTIYNPVIDTSQAFLRSPPPHSWLKDDEQIPVLVAVGRLSPEKNYPELIEALSILHARRRARLIILGEGSERKTIEKLISDYELSDDVDLVGWVAEPSDYLCHADSFVLTSHTEGLSIVLIEALACGCAAVAYDCPHGPREILDYGRYGQLVPLGDVNALASALERSLLSTWDRQALIARGRSFSIEASVTQYMTLIHDVIERRA